jgi:N6-L-threonylcarbamoyladenine synthase
VVSGGHTLLVLVKSFTEIEKLGTTADDAAGEAFDKVAKLLGMPYPGGPEIQKAAAAGNPDKIEFPVAETKNPYDFSFSGLKTSVLRFVQKNYKPEPSENGDPIVKKYRIPEKDLNNIAASFQKAVIAALVKNTEKALVNYDPSSLSLVGGVAANSELRKTLVSLAKRYNKKIVIPDPEFCGDNAAMIAFRGVKLYEAGRKFDLNYTAYPGMSFE